MNTITIIDDYALVRDAWSIMLKTAGKYEITDKISKTSQVADIIRESKPDLVLLGVNPAQHDGMKLLNVIRKFSPATRVIAVSMQLETAYVKKLLKNGAKGYVTKNCPAQELLRAVDSVAKGEIYVCKEFKGSLADQAVGDTEKSPGIENLTKRELQIIEHLRQGESSKQIAEKMSIAPKTVEAHRHNIFKKLKVKNAIALIELVSAYGM